MNEEEKRVLLSILIKEINIYNEKQPNGQWLKEIEFALPIIAD
jgi:site-specific DNA recombinase